MSLVELAVSMSVLSLIIFSVGMTLIVGIRDREDTSRDLRALSELRDVVAEMQDITNDLPNVLIDQGPGALFSLYDGQEVALDSLGDAKVSIVCYANEATVPAELGGPQDLNLDGDAKDDLDNESIGTDLKLIPAALTVSFGANNERSFTVYRLFARTTE